MRQTITLNVKILLKNMNYVYFFLFVFAVNALACATCYAASDAIRIANIRVIDAYPVYYIEQEFKLNLDIDSLNRVGGATNVRIRVFGGTKERLIKQFWTKTDDECYLYPSTSFTATAYNGGIYVNINEGKGNKFDLAWLDVSGQQVKAKPFVVIFEIKNNSDDFIKLRYEDLSRYFSIGHEFSVAPRTAYAPESVRDAAQEARKRDEAIANKLREKAKGKVEPTKGPPKRDIYCHKLVEVMELNNVYAKLEPYMCVDK